MGSINPPNRTLQLVAKKHKGNRFSLVFFWPNFKVITLVNGYEFVLFGGLIDPISTPKPPSPGPGACRDKESAQENRFFPCVFFT